MYVIKGDTIVGLQPNQVKSINKMYEYSKLLKGDNVQLSNTLTEYRLLSTEKDSIIAEKNLIELRLSNKMSVMVENNSILRHENDLLIGSIGKTKKVAKIGLISSGVLLFMLLVAL